MLKHQHGQGSGLPCVCRTTRPCWRTPLAPSTLPWLRAQSPRRWWPCFKNSPKLCKKTWTCIGLRGLSEQIGNTHTAELLNIKEMPRSICLIGKRSIACITTGCVSWKLRREQTGERTGMIPWNISLEYILYLKIKASLWGKKGGGNHIYKKRFCSICSSEDIYGVCCVIPDLSRAIEYPPGYCII